MRKLLLRLSCQKFNALVGFLLLSASLWSQQSISIVDENNEALIGVEVFTSDFSFSAITDVDGRVQLTAEARRLPLQIKYLGYEEITLLPDDLATANYRIQLVPSTELLDEVLVVGRTDESRERLAYQIEHVSQRDMALTQSQTTADALAAHAQVFVQKSQMGGGSPVIRGFEANKVLLVVDGVRLNNAIYRNGHLQNAITIDQAMLERMEVIYGPNSLSYGSDALGGVIHFRSRLPKLNYATNQQLALEGRYYVRYASANQEKSAHVDVNIGTRRFASLTSFTVSDYGDLRAGGQRLDRYPDFGKRFQYVDSDTGEDRVVDNEDVNVQVGTAYRQYDVLQKWLYKPSERAQWLLNVQFSTSTDVPRYDRLIEEEDDGTLKFAEWHYGPQKRFLSALEFRTQRASVFYDDAQWIASYQRIDEDRIDRRLGSAIRSHQEEDVDVWALTADFSKRFSSPAFRLTYGVDLNWNRVGSVAFFEDITSNTLDFSALTRYPSDGSTMNSQGVYIRNAWQNRDSSVILNTGLRFTRTALRIQYRRDDVIAWPEHYFEGIESQNEALTWSVGLIWKAEHHWQFRAMSSSAFRSPNIDDLAKIRVKGGEVTVPNPILDPERSVNGEVTLSKFWFGTDQQRRPRFEVHATGFYTYLTDAIVRQPFQLPDGSAYLLEEGDTLVTVSNVNAQKAHVYGLSSTLAWSPDARWKVDASINYVKGRIINDGADNTPLAHIPPTYGKAGVQYSHRGWTTRVAYRFNLEKPLSEYGDSSDNLELATPDGTPRWDTFNVYFSKQWNASLQFKLAFENILDRHYRPFASGVSAPGRNLVFSVNGKF